MIKIKCCFALLIVLLTLNLARGQSRAYQEVHIGQKVPDLLLSGFLNDSAKTVNLKNLYTHKLLILDFWATWCSPCIRGLGELDSLKQRFGNKICIVAVGYESNKVISDFFKKYPQLVPKYNPVITNDSLLSRKLFPHVGLPHLVWIDSTGKVVTITEGGYANQENIKKVLNGDTLKVNPKIDQLHFNSNAPFHLMDTSFYARSLFTGYTKGIQSYESVISPEQVWKLKRLFLSNTSIRDLYRFAVYAQYYGNRNSSRLIFDIRDSMKYFEPGRAPMTYKSSKYKTWTDWAQENAYCYDLSFPYPMPETVLRKYMIEDLNRYLNLNGRFEKRKTLCFSLRILNNKYKELLKYPRKVGSIEQKFGKPVKITAQPINKLCDILNRFIENGVIINETGIHELITMDLDDFFKQPVRSKKTFNMVLNRFGLGLVECNRLVNVFVVSEN